MIPPPGMVTANAMLFYCIGYCSYYYHFLGNLFLYGSFDHSNLASLLCYLWNSPLFVIMQLTKFILSQWYLVTAMPFGNK